MMKKIILCLVVVVCGLSMTTCSFDSDTVFFDTRMQDYKLYDHYVDEYGNEGVVALIARKYGEIGFIIVVSMDEGYEPWGPMGEVVCDNDSLNDDILEDFRFSLDMLQRMKVRGIERYPAQAWCDAKNGAEPYTWGGSWRLPSYYELALVFGVNGIAKLNKALLKYGGTPVSADNMYWSCVEDYDGYLTLEGQQDDFDKENRSVITNPMGSSYTNKDRWIKKTNHFVRAIKYIYYADL